MRDKEKKTTVGVNEIKKKRRKNATKFMKHEEKMH